MDSASSDHFCYGQYSSSVDFNSTDILPPVSDQGAAGDCAAHALLCVLEARYRKAQKWAPGPKSRWRLSIKDLVHNLYDLKAKTPGNSLDTPPTPGFTLGDANLAMGGVGYGKHKDVEPYSGVGLYDDNEGMGEGTDDEGKDRRQQPGVKFDIKTIIKYVVTSKPRSQSPTWKSVR